MLFPLLQTYRHSQPPWELFRSLDRPSRVGFFLDSIRYRPPDQAYSYLGFDPFLELTVSGEQLKVSGEVTAVYPASSLFKVLRRLLQRFRVPSRYRYPFFTGGAVGYWSYELSRWFDRIRFRPKPGAPIPDLWLGFYRDVIVFDHAKGAYHLVSLYENKPGHRQKALQRIEALKRELSAVRGHTCVTERARLENFHPDISKERFIQMVRRAKDYIAAGDIYQANLSQRFSFDFEGSPHTIYERLRQVNPSPFASFFNFGALKIISSSPERLIRKQGRRCDTRPIAGTRPRRAASRGFGRAGRELLASAKERAEHIMLVDLERNDLGRVCDYKTVRVEEMMTLEKYSHVIHIVSKIAGRLSRGRDSLDLIRAMFPGGTITGCPKIRCMEIIDELEPVRRGIYTGSVGYLDFRGDLDLNIVIRTLLLQGRQGTFQVGAGIVHDSDPEREYEETLHKGEAMAEALVKASVLSA